MSLEGKKAPAFNLADQNQEAYSLNSFEEDYLVLFFYPKDDTPGCTVESISFSENLAKFKKLNALPIGISGGDHKTKKKFCQKHSLKSLMLSDSDFSVAQKYGIYGEKSFMGRKYLGISRSTFILDAKRKVIKVFDQVKPDQHVEEVLQFIKEYNSK